MAIHTAKLTEKTQGHCDIIDITAKVQHELERQKIRRGLATLFVSGSTASLTTIEYESGVLKDLQELLEKLIPSNRKYHHDDRWRDDNGFSHLRASLLGPSLQVPIEDGRLLLGTWQQIVLLDFDPSTRAPGMAGSHSLGIPPANRGVVLSERSESKDNASGASRLRVGLHNRPRTREVVVQIMGENE
jgi:secondary thiamine-phosphate synthase enzyme